VHAPRAVPQPRPRLQPLHHRVNAIARITKHRDAEPVPLGGSGFTRHVAAPAKPPPPAIGIPGQLSAEVPAPVPGLGQQQPAVYGEDGAGDVVVLHQVQVGGGDLAGIAHGLSQRPPGQGRERCFPLRLGQPVPQRRAERPRPDRVDPDRGH
jgi:hypothetical protein